MAGQTRLFDGMLNIAIERFAHTVDTADAA
jgi:hypothetical protein